MRSYRNMNPLAMPSQTASEKRRKGRVRADVLKTTLGTAMDLSESGARIERRGAFKLPVGTAVVVVLSAPGHSLTCPSRVAWVKKAGWFKTHIGIEFLDTSEPFRRALRELSRACMDMRTIAADSEELARRAG